ncbi:MAG: hypothetical protein JWN77_1881, partial [Frankiales bacterium]|nr:hypothetical protein [Frankiales bacterium]
MQHRRSQLLLLLGTALAALVLLLAAPSPATAVADLQHAGGAADPFVPLVAAVTLLAYLLAGWLLAVVLATLAGRLPGIAGRAAAGIAARIAPAAVRRAV